MSEISNSDDIIDSRDIIERIQVLTEAEDKEEYEIEELKVLQALAEECKEYSDWKYGTTLIRESYWMEFCQTECEELGYVSKVFPWWIKIDWESTAENMQQDYAEIDFDGVSYYIRNC